MLTVAACSGPIGETPRPTVADFEGVVGELHARGVAVSEVKSGDPGCANRDLVGPAISFLAQGLDQAQPTLLRLYVFRNLDTYNRRRSEVDACAREFVTDPSSFEAVDAPPLVAVGPGPWAAGFRDAVRAALTAGSGTVASPAPSPS